jgi:hypothetical protein
MKIAVLAWGSLVWDRRDLAVAGNFEPTGPRLPIEFCRVSGDGRLTLVIDEACGASCVTYVAVSTFGELLAAIENLRTREGMPNASAVGFVDLASAKRSGASERLSATLKRSRRSRHGPSRTAMTPQSGQRSEATLRNATRRTNRSRLRLRSDIWAN